MSAEEFRCDWKSWCVRVECHDGDCEPLAPSRLYEAESPLEAAKLFAVRCSRCHASERVRCVGAINEPERFHVARFILAGTFPSALREGTEPSSAAGKVPESESQSAVAPARPSEAVK